MRKVLRIFRLLLLVLIIVPTQTMSVIAQVENNITYCERLGIEDLDDCIDVLRSQDIYYVDLFEQKCEFGNSGPVPKAVTPSSIYVIGDSITVGMKGSGDLEEKLTGAGWTPTKINAVGGKTIEWGTEQISIDANIIAQSNNILIGLGTNNAGNVVSTSGVIGNGEERVRTKMQELVDAVKAVNPDINIFWTSVYITGIYNEKDLDLANPILNKALTDVATKNSVIIIPWGTSNEAKQYTSSDGIHPYGKYSEMAEYVVKQLGSGGAGTPKSETPGCQCSAGSGAVGDDNKQYVFNYFVGKGYPTYQAAGIVGNMMAESSVKTIRIQKVYTYSDRWGVDLGLLVPDDPNNPNGYNTDGGVLVKNIPAAISQLVSAGKFDDPQRVGWGLVQWTPASKMYQTSLDAGITEETIQSIEYQTEFVWSQLEGTPIDPSLSKKPAGDKLKATTNITEATIAFGKYYEVFRGHKDTDERTYEGSSTEYQKRIDNANAIHDIYAGQAPAVGSSQGGCSNYRAGRNGWDLPKEGPNQMVYYSQLDSGEDPAVTGYYGKGEYGIGTIGACGCGPTSWAMVVSTLTNNTVTPPEVARWAYENNMQQEGCGSKWWWEAIPEKSEAKWGVRGRQIPLAEAADHIKQGKLIIASVGPGSPLISNGSSGHLLVMRAVTDDGKFLFADPSDTQEKRNDNPIIKELGSSRTPLAPSDFQESLKGLFVIEKL